MASYAPVSRSDGVIQGHQAPTGGHFHDGGGIRREWWWQDGPVDTCCFCCTLRTGVGLLAASDLVTGVITVLFVHMMYAVSSDIPLAHLREQYSRDCTDHVASTVDCDKLAKAITGMESRVDLSGAIQYVQGVLHVVAGATGLYAVSGDSVQAARVYMLSWPANFFLGLLVALQHPWSTEVDPAYKGLEITGSLMTGVQTVILVYYFKVSWSYYKRRADHQNARDGVSSNVVHQGQPMVPLNIA